ALALDADARFRTGIGRRRSQPELDRAVAALTCKHDHKALAFELQHAGVPAGPVLDASDALNDPHLADRGAFQEVEHRFTGCSRWPGPMYHLSGTPLSIYRPPVSVGEDNEYVYKELLGFSNGEYE